MSSFNQATCGVPQGSILGTLYSSQYNVCDLLMHPNNSDVILLTMQPYTLYATSLEAK